MDSRIMMSASADVALARLADELAARVRHGEPIDWDSVAHEHPEHAAELRDLVPAMAALGELSASAGRDSRAFAADGTGKVTGVLGDFRIVREVGRGGMGVVYEAEQVSLSRRVALKVLPFAATIDPKHLQRFHNEARAAASLHHPNIAPVFGVGVDRGLHFYAMQFIEGVTLARVISDSHRPAPPSTPTEPTGEYVPGEAASTLLVAGLSTENGRRGPEFYQTAARLMSEAAEALEHAHSVGIVHRDVKPGNLIVDAAGKLWVADFGLAKCGPDAGLTMSGDLVGTLRYMSPEQAMARHGLVDHRTDIYALGATLYELLTGRPVVTGDDKQEILRQIAFDEPLAPRKLTKAIPTDLETIVLKAIEKNPADRYASAKELAEDLRRLLDGEPVRAKRPSLARRAAKWARRHQSVAATAAAALGILLIGMGAALGKVSAAKRNADEREAETRAVLNFVEDKIFAAARPEGVGGGLGHDVTLRRAVEAALPFVEESFSEQPLIEARLRMTLGLSFRHLGDDATAARQFQAAYALYGKHRGPDHPDTLLCASKLANSYTGLGQQIDALKLHEETFRQRRATLGPDHPDTIASMINLGVVYDNVGRYDDALRLREEALSLAKDKLVPDHADTLMCMNNLAISYANVAWHDKALKLREEVLKLQKTKPVPDTEVVLAGMNNVAESYHALGRYADARKLYAETLDQANAKLSPTHRDTLRVMNNFAWFLATAGDIEYRDPARAVELATKASQSSPNHAGYLGTLGTALYRAGDWRQALIDLENAINLRDAADPLNANESFFLAMARGQLGEREAARAWFDKGVAWMTKAKRRLDETRRFRAEAAELLGIKDEIKNSPR